MTLSPLVDRARLESLIRRKRVEIERYAERLADAELERQILERELGRTQQAEAVPACTGLTASWCPLCGDCTCPRDTSAERTLTDDGCPLHAFWSDHAEDSRAEHPAQPDDGVGAPTRSQDPASFALAPGQVVPGLAPGGVPTTPDPSAPDAGGDARPESARSGASTARGVTSRESAATTLAGSGDPRTVRTRQDTCPGESPEPSPLRRVVRCEHLFAAGLCVHRSCPHWDGRVTSSEPTYSPGLERERARRTR